MVSSKHGARISEKDVFDLNNAADQLASAHAVIKRANPVWADSAMQLLALAQETVIRIRDKGAATFARYLERRGLQTSPGAPEIAAPGAELSEERQIVPGEEEE